MAEKYCFFDSTPEDERVYTADEFAEYFRRVLTDGIFNGGTNLKVEASGTNIQTFIQPGYAWLQGYMYKVDTDPLYLTHDLPHATYDRIDRVVIRLDKTLENRYVKAFVKKGTAATNPAPPALTRNQNVFEISLAQVRIIKGKSYIEGSQVTDERLNTSVCGLVNSLIQADTTSIFNQFQSWYNSKTAAYQKEWSDWFAAATSSFEQQWQQWFDSIQGQTPVKSVNNKTGNVVLNAADVGAETPAGAQSKVDAHASNTKLHVNSAEKLVTDLPSAYLEGITSFSLTTTTSQPWRDAVGLTGSHYAVVEVFKWGSYAIQRITFFYTADGTTKGTYQREGYTSTWRSWKKVAYESDLTSDKINRLATNAFAESVSMSEYPLGMSVFYVQNSSNSWLGKTSGFFVVETLKTVHPACGTQRATYHGNTATYEVWERSIGSNTVGAEWGPWVRVDSIGVQADLNAHIANKNNPHGVTSDQINRLADNSFTEATSMSSYPKGISVFYVGNTAANLWLGKTSGYMCVETYRITNTGAAWGTQRVTYYGDADTREVWQRSVAKNTVGATWGAWVRVDRGITYGTANPSGGVDGDIYFQYE